MGKLWIVGVWLGAIGTAAWMEGTNNGTSRAVDGLWTGVQVVWVEEMRRWRVKGE